MADKDKYRDDLLNRYASHTFTETTVQSMTLVEFRDGGDAIIAQAQKLDVADAYKEIRRDLLKNKEIKFQVKRKSIKEAQNADYTIALSSSVENDNSNRILTSDWLLDVIKNQTETKKWLENSLRWFIEDTSKNSIFELID